MTFLQLSLQVELWFLAANAQVHRKRNGVRPAEVILSLDISDLFSLGINISNISDIWSLEVVLFGGAKRELRLS